MRVHPVDAKLAPQTYPLVKRVACWLLWKTPVLSWPWRILARVLRIKSPYRKVVLVCRVLPGMPPPGRSKEINRDPT